MNTDQCDKAGRPCDLREIRQEQDRQRFHMMEKRQEIEILYRDRHICVCRKPAGIPCESAKALQPDIVKLLKKKIFFQNPEKGEPSFFLVHRLDQPVGGILLLAGNGKAAAELSKQIRNHEFVKQYLAVVMLERRDMASCGHLEDYLVRDGRTNTSKIASKENKQAKKAVLDYEILEVRKYGKRDVGLARITLRTGRHHQIRVQMAAHGMPLLFDQKYNPEYQQRPLGEDVALYAFHLKFRHPWNGEKMEFTDYPSNEIFRIWEAVQNPIS